jgi:hypothetical protein
MPINPILASALLSGAVGGVKTLVDADREGRQRRLAAEKARMSPWTGIKPNEVEEADPIGNTLQAVTTGISLGQGIENAGMANDLRAAEIDYLKSMTPEAFKAAAPEVAPAITAPAPAPTPSAPPPFSPAPMSNGWTGMEVPDLYHPSALKPNVLPGSPWMNYSR